MWLISWKLVNLWFTKTKMTARATKIRISLCFSLLLTAAGMQLPFLPLWLEAKGLTHAQIASILASMLVARSFAQPLMSWLADHFQNRHTVIRMCTASALTAIAFLSQQEGYFAIQSVLLLATFLFSPVFPLVESFSVDASSALKLDYGRMRLWASLSFLSGSLFAGILLTMLPASSAIYLIIGGYALAFIAVLTLPPEVPRHHFDANELADTSTRRLFFASPFTIMILAVSAAMASHALLNGFSSVHWTNLRFNTFAISVFWSCSVLAEVLLFAFSNRVVAWLGVNRLILIGITGGIIRWTGMAFAQSAWAFVPLSMMHVLSFAMTHLGVMHFIRTSVPLRKRNTAQGLYSAISGGVFMAGSTYMSGPLFEKYGSEAFLLMTVISATALLLALAAINWKKAQTS
jgi:MFS transporter, PPP family, 3-phenylpropionic acid transporter